MINNIQWKFFNHLVEHYQGTCNTFLDYHMNWLEEHDLLWEFDQTIFNCSTCGWWCEISEVSTEELDEPICGDCTE